MKARMTSRVTVMPRLESGDDRPVKGLRNGTRARAVAKCPASNETSSATIGARAVATSGRFPIAMGVTFAAARAERQLPAARAAPAPPDGLEFPARAPRHTYASHIDQGLPSGSAVVPYGQQHTLVAVLPARGSRWES